MQGTKVPSPLLGMYGTQLGEEIYRVLGPGGSARLTSATPITPVIIDNFRKAGFDTVTLKGGVLFLIK